MHLNKRLTYLFLVPAIPGLSIGRELRCRQLTMEDGPPKSGARYLDRIFKTKASFQRHISILRRLLRMAFRRQPTVLMLLLAPIFSPFLLSQTHNVKIQNVTFPDGQQLTRDQQAQELHFRHYNIKDGLVHSGTGSREVIIQDKEGFLWFSTHWYKIRLSFLKGNFCSLLRLRDFGNSTRRAGFSGI